jgi:hypothetical protein
MAGDGASGIPPERWTRVGRPALAKAGSHVILVTGRSVEEQPLSTIQPAPAEARDPEIEGRVRPNLMLWLPALVLGAGLALGLVLWARWGLVIALEMVRAYCF